MISVAKATRRTGVITERMTRKMIIPINTLNATHTISMLIWI